VITVLDHAGALRRSGCELLPRHGWLALQQAWTDRVASEFVRRTRYDPLHEAAASSGCGRAARLARDAGARVRGDHRGRGRRHAARGRARARDFADAAGGIYEAVVQALQRARPARGPLHLRVSHRWATLPGFAERLAGLRDCEVVRLPRGAAALGALAFESTLRRDPAALVLVQRLPVRRASPGCAGAVAALGAGRRAATHVVFRGRARAIAGARSRSGGGAGGRRALEVPAGPGVSRLHCTLAADADGAWLEDRSTYGTLVNGERVGGRAALRAGDRLRLGSPGVELELVRVWTTMARRKTEVFSLSFLDVIACGFGAVVLFYTILSAQAGVQREKRNDDLQAEVDRSRRRCSRLQEPRGAEELAREHR